MKLNNKGLSLVELLVALAVSLIVISAVVALIGNGVNSSRKQVNQAQVQEEANITMNNISDSVMEASDLKISTSGTGDKNTILLRVDSSTGEYKEYVFNESKHELYINTQATEADPNDSAVQNNLLCSNVTSFKVQIMSTSLETEGDNLNTVIKKIKNPIQLKVSITLEKSGFKRDISRVTGLRNSLDEIGLKKQGDISYTGINKQDEADYLNNLDVIAK